MTFQWKPVLYALARAVVNVNQKITIWDHICIVDKWQGCQTVAQTDVVMQKSDADM